MKQHEFLEPTIDSRSLTCPPLLTRLPVGPGSGSEMDKSKREEKEGGGEKTAGGLAAHFFCPTLQEMVND